MPAPGRWGGNTTVDATPAGRSQARIAALPGPSQPLSLPLHLQRRSFECPKIVHEIRSCNPAESQMSRLRYPFTEISARCRLCGGTGFTASSEHALGGRLIDWRRAHASECPEWPRWAEEKGLRLDPNGALLYPMEEGPYEPSVRARAIPNSVESTSDSDTSMRPEGKVDLMVIPAEELEQHSLF